MTASAAPLRDTDLRGALTDTIARRYRGREHLLAPEVEILCGIPGRIDALLIADKICGFEIKSDVDSLRRLPRQLQAYEPVLERAILIVGDRHLEAGGALLPPWWGIWRAHRRGDRVVLDVQRPARPNPEFYTYGVTRFIDRQAITLHMRTLGRSGYSKYGVDELRSQLVKIHTRGEILALARWVMRARGDWRYRDGAIMHPPNPSPEERARVPSWYRPARCGCPVCEKTAPPTKSTVVYR
ncbi:sce7726 family protein [Mycobacteroides abscessus subsp. massiliense]|uniref:sce7726 family protein n=1 Tax=Mycobacteroides abscessus TaxID=36809 RepID=UPI0009A68D1A|nr:sce7726 family protein [Mycobacteroides abscessus]MDO3208823.1 sce7726 family protein [Mycobacteroides abscessus subsp. massiliense]SKT80634.1 Uncharacterised protein [Mycobacteroides abscessus subsp. massiliense]SKT99221.1 Uncharacterised protein [Mycobacteroides abscessus subsp. massiliense]